MSALIDLQPVSRHEKLSPKALPLELKSRYLSSIAVSQTKSHLPAEVLPTHTAALFNTAVKRAAELLRAGEVVALPTETVYGLAANAFDAKAVEKIFTIKGRPANNPIIVHVADYEMAKRCVSDWPDTAEKLARAFWPGPLTMVLPRSKEINDLITAGGSTVGVRWPSHPFIQAVIRECGFPLAAPSANPSNGISPTNASHVWNSMAAKIPLIVDGGQSQVGIESTVIGLCAEPIRILRPGIIHLESLQAVLGGKQLMLGPTMEHPEGILRSPGQLLRHYSPKANLEISSWRNAQELEEKIKKRTSNFAKVHIIAHTGIPADIFGRVSVIPHDAEAFARAIYAELHQCDEEGAEWIFVEAVPETSEWHAIADRLKRAAAKET
jgi:L-threonylcarbamoyladenylate synthase